MDYRSAKDLSRRPTEPSWSRIRLFRKETAVHVYPQNNIMTGVSWAADTIAADCVASLPDGPPTQMRIRNRWTLAGHINVPEMRSEERRVGKETVSTCISRW